MDAKVTVSLPRDAHYVAVVRSLAERLLRDAEAPSDAVDDAKLVVSEACGNAVRHATGASAYSVTVAVDDHGFEVEVADHGPGLGASRRDGESDSEHGRGIMLMRALVDDLDFENADAGMRVRMRRRWDRNPFGSGPSQEERIDGALEALGAAS